MAVAVRITEEGIVIPSDAAQLLGYHIGDWAEVEVRRLPSSRELQSKALHFILHHLGDAVHVGEPVWIGDGWSLPLHVRGIEGVLGELVLSREEEVIESRSTSRSELQDAIDAACTPAAAAA